MASKGDILVFDEEFLFASRELKAYGIALNQLLTMYCNNMDLILKNAVKDDIISNDLRDIANKVSGLKGEIASSCLLMSSYCKTYINEIDSADDFLY